jgi:hypothetical protein
MMDLHGAWCMQSNKIGLIGPRTTSIPTDGKWSVTMRGVSDCLSQNPFHANCPYNKTTNIWQPNLSCCPWPYTFRASLRPPAAGASGGGSKEELAALSISSVNFGPLHPHSAIATVAVVAGPAGDAEVEDGDFDK